jgi:glycerol-3-phosphate acyltransferase PlsX
MGGDNAPGAIVKGSAMAARAFKDTTIILVGDKYEIGRFLPSPLSDRIIVVHTFEQIRMDEKAAAVRTRKNASVVLTARIASEKGVRKAELPEGNEHLPELLRAEGMVACGNTAAAMATATLGIGRIEDIDRPALAAIFPRGAILLDVGAVVDCSPDQLKQFALMGRAYAKRILGKRNPTVGILTIGGEDGKGNDQVSKASPVLKQGLEETFIGNAEGRDLFGNRVDVIVTDGFAGNVALKTAEGTVEYFRDEVKNTLWLSWPAIPFFWHLKKKTASEEHGGAPLLGIDGVCIIGHGSSDARAAKNAVGAARKAVENNLVAAIIAEIEQYKKACT